MAMSDTSSTDWINLYRQNLADRQGLQAPTMFGPFPSASEATVVTTTMASATTPGPMATAIATGATTTHLNAEARVGRPARRRTRATRRAQTTVLNTDPTNFRAMVQQFTGIHTPTLSSATSGSRFLADRSVLNFGLQSDRHRLPMMIDSSSQPHQIPHHLQHHHHQRQQQDNPNHHHQHQQQLVQQQGGYHVFSGVQTQTDDAFLAEMSNPRSNLEISDGFLQGFSSHVLPRQTSTENQAGGYIL